MTEAQAKEAMKQRWIDTWPTLQPLVPYSFRGEVIDSADAWVRVTFRALTEEQATLGRTARYDYRGIVFVQLFVSVGVGESQLDALAESVRAVFRSRSIAVGTEEITLYAGPPVPMPEEDRWIGSVMSIPYWFEQQA